MGDKARARSLLAGIALLLGAAPIPARATQSFSELLVGFRPGAGTAQRATAHLRARAVVLDAIGDLGVDVVRVPGGTEHALRAYAGDPSVAFVERNLRGRVAAAPPAAPSDPTWTRIEQWRLRRAGALQAWQRSPGKYFTAATKPRTAVKVAVLDTVIDQSQPDFANLGGSSTNARSGGQIDVTDAKAYVPSARQRGVNDWHGTFIAGIIGASADNRLSVMGAGYVAQLMPVVVADGAGVVTAANAANGILWALSRGAKIINASFAIPAGASGSATLKAAVERAGAAGAVVVAAAGNNERTRVMLPAAYAKDHAYVIAVGASDPFDNLAACSNYNSYLTVVAPGTNLMSLAVGGGTKSVLCGTSAATALVSGTAALVATRFTGISGTSIRQRIERGADDVGRAGRDIYTGAGRLNMTRAVWADGGPATTVAKPAPAGAGNRATVAGLVRSSYAITAAEYSIDVVVAPGRGSRLAPADRKWGGTAERISAVVDTSKLAEGFHDVYVRALDRSGRWGAPAATVLIVDRTAPALTNVKIDPAVVVPHDPKTTISWTVSDALTPPMRVSIQLIDAQSAVKASYIFVLPSGVYRGTWHGTTDPPASKTWKGAALPPGPYTLTITARDGAGNAATQSVQCAIAPEAPEAPA